VPFFFFQAEDGIRDFHVTGVQTCALPISARPTDSRPNMRLSPGSNSTSVWGFSPFTVNAQTRDGPTVSRQASRSGWTATIARSRDRTIVVEGKRGRRGGRRNLGNASRAEL